MGMTTAADRVASARITRRAWGGLVAVAGRGGDDLELGAGAPRRRLSRCRLIRLRFNSAILRRPLDVLRRPHDRAALMPVAVLLGRRARKEPFIEIRASRSR